MADFHLTQTDADALIGMPKRRVDDTQVEYPGLGGTVTVPLVSENKREHFMSRIISRRRSLTVAALIVGPAITGRPAPLGVEHARPAALEQRLEARPAGLAVVATDQPHQGLSPAIRHNGKSHSASVAYLSACPSIPTSFGSKMMRRILLRSSTGTNEFPSAFALAESRYTFSSICRAVPRNLTKAP